MTSLFESMGRTLARPIWYLSKNRTSQWGVIITTAGAVSMLSFWIGELFGVSLGPYAGIIVFLILPGVVALGLLLIPIGLLLNYRQERAKAATIEYQRISFADGKVRETLAFIALMTAINVGLFMIATYRGVSYMDSTTFCGQACHSVMAPEYTAYQNSPHARVDCVKCHIGPGAPFFVKAKISGAWQVVSVNLNLYPRPLPTPIENLRPSNDTCEQCHWPLKFAGDKLVVKHKYAEDEANSATTTVLLMHIGGLDPLTRQPLGNHGVHLEPGSEITYVAADRKRQEIPLVRYRRASGEVEEYLAEGSAKTAAQWMATGRARRMDCIDCHNRPTHTFQMPGPMVDQALAADVIGRGLPFAKKNALEILQTPYSSREEADRLIRAKVRDLYQGKAESKTVERAANELARIYSLNVFPAMKVNWGAYPNNLGHDPFPGCFRCHDGNHKTANGKVIQNDCNACHNLLAMEEKSPEILKSLGTR